MGHQWVAELQLLAPSWNFSPVTGVLDVLCCLPSTSVPEEPKPVRICLCPPWPVGSTWNFGHAALLVEPDLEILIDCSACQGHLSHRCPICLPQPGETPSKSLLPLEGPTFSRRSLNTSWCHKQAVMIIFDSRSGEGPHGFDSQNNLSQHLLMLQRLHVLITSVGRNVEKLNPSYAASRNVNPDSHCENQ